MYQKYVDAIKANKTNPKQLNELFEEIAYDDSITNEEYCKLVELAIDCCRSEGIRVYPVI